MRHQLGQLDGSYLFRGVPPPSKPTLSESHLSLCQNTAEIAASAGLDVQTEVVSDVLVDMEAFLD